MGRRTPSQASRKSHRTSSHNGSIRSDTTTSLVIAALLPQGLEPTLTLTFNALQCLVQRSNWILEMFFPQLKSRFISSRMSIKLFLSVFGCFQGPQGFCLLSLLRLPHTTSTTHYLVGVMLVVLSRRLRGQPITVMCSASLDVTIQCCPSGSWTNSR